MAKKIYCIVKATRSPCFGGDGGGAERVEINIENKKDAKKSLVAIRKSNMYKHVVYWIDFDWKQ